MSQWFFAWSGATIPDPFLAVVTGTVNGGKTQTLSTTANTTAGDVFLDNVTASGITAGTLYGVSGPGVIDGTLLMYTAASGGDPATYQVNAAPTQTGGSVTLTLTKSITIAQTFGDVSGGTLSNIGDTAALVPGVYYSVSGVGIPAGSLVYWGGGTSGTLATISGGSVNASSSSGIPLTFSALPSAASSVLTNVSGVDSLTPGGTYNISGPGIPAGTTFIANGTSTITIDQPATAAQLGASLTIDGPLVDTDPFDAAKHAVYSENIRSIKITQKEGSFAELEITLQNPGTGLLKAGGQEWCWLSYDAGGGNVVPMFNGRIVGIFADLQLETVQLNFTAQPNNYVAAKRDLAKGLTVLPYVDPVWLTTSAIAPDTVLETRSLLWHIDRLTLDVTTSDILVGEDGTIDVTGHRYDSVRVAIGQPPITRVHGKGTVSWTQQGSGTVDLTSKAYGLFAAAKSIYGGSVLGNKYIVSTLTDGLKSSWPTLNTSLGCGWTFGENTQIKDANYVVGYSTSTTIPSADVTYFDLNLAKWKVSFPIYNYTIGLDLDWSASRKRTETVEFTMISDLQRMVSQPAGSDAETITVTADDIGEAIDLDNTPPIGDLRNNSYFTTSRGVSSFENLLLMARAKIRARARAVDITFQVPLHYVLDISCRHNVHLVDRRLPGGEATGKVKEYSLIQDQQGRPYAEIMIGCAIGRGGSVTAAVGTGAWVQSGVVGNGIQILVGGQTAVVSGELVYQALTDFPISDDGLNLFDLKASDVINSFDLTNGLKAQTTAVQSSIDPLATFDGVPTRLCLDLKPLDGEFNTDYTPAVKPLPIPKTIDLEAA